MLYTFLIGIGAFILGFTLGMYFKNLMLNNLDWTILKWDDNIFGYRPTAKGYVIKKNDKVFMALKIPTEKLTKEGLKYD